jgi:DNA-binding transcriptional LysR family regulator
VSASVAALQKSLGVALVTPDGRGLRLTDAVPRTPGTRAASWACSTSKPGRDGRAAPSAASCGSRRSPRHRADRASDPRWLPPPPPQTGVRLGGNRDRVRSLLDRHQADLVLTGRPEPAWDVTVHAVRAHELVVVAAPDLATAALADSGQDAGTLLPWLARQTWLLREPGSGTRASTDALLADLDITPLTLMVASNVAIRESAQVGLGVTLLSRDAVAAELAAGKLAELPVPGTPPHRDWYLAARPGPLPPPAARLVAHALRAGGFRSPDAADQTPSG